MTIFTTSQIILVLQRFHLAGSITDDLLNHYQINKKLQPLMQIAGRYTEHMLYIILIFTCISFTVRGLIYHHIIYVLHRTFPLMWTHLMYPIWWNTYLQILPTASANSSIGFSKKYIRFRGFSTWQRLSPEHLSVTFVMV